VPGGRCPIRAGSLGSLTPVQKPRDSDSRQAAPGATSERSLHTGRQPRERIRKPLARPATGQVVRPTPGQPCFALRFRAYGKREYLTLGKPEDGWTLAMAQRELAVVLRDVDLGTWRPPRPDPAPAKNTNPTFHEFASDWFAAKRLEIEPNTASSYGNDLTNHLLTYFKHHRISEITVAEVDRYRQSKVREAAEITAAAENGTPMTVAYVDRLGRSYRRRARPLSARSINMHIDLLTQILAVAVDHGHIPSNPAVGKRRRLKLSKPRPVHLDSAEQIAILLEAAGELDRGEAVIDVMDRGGRPWTQRHPILTTGQRAAIATLLLGGGRASATGAMLWREVDLANGRFVVGRDKTDAGMREVDMLPLLREILTEHKAASEHAGPDDPVFVTSSGTALAPQHPPGRRRRGGCAREQARRRARPATPAARDHPAQICRPLGYADASGSRLA
jgi:integrase